MLIQHYCHLLQIPLTELFLIKCQIIKFWLKKHHLFVIIMAGKQKGNINIFGYVRLRF